MLTAAVREWQFDKLRKSVKVIGYVVQGIAQGDATTYRDGGTGWTVVEVMGHLVDFEAIFLERARLIVEQDNPDLPYYDPDELVIARNHNAQNLQGIYTRWVEHRATFLDYLAERDETAWERVGKHPRRGPLTLAQQLLLTGWHDINHLEQMTHILLEKKVSQ